MLSLASKPNLEKIIPTQTEQKGEYRMSHNGKVLIYKIHRHEEVPVIPWVPYAGIHSGKVTGYTATEVLKDPDKLFESIMEINRIYDPDGQTVMFDLQLEAEILGCDLYWADYNLPSVISHPLAETDEIPSKIPAKTEGRLPMVLDVMKRFKEAVGEKTASYGLFCGPFTLASHLRGTKIFINMKRDPDYVHRLLAFTTKVSMAMCDYYEEAGIDILAAVDPLMSQISPKHFETFFSKPYKELFHYIRGKKIFSSFFVCGDATHNLRLMCECSPDALAVDENVNMVIAKKITDEYNIVLGGNIPLTTTMLFGTQQANMKYTLNLIDDLKTAGLDIHRNFIIAPGCDMPYDIPPQNAIAVGQAAHDPESVRSMVENYEDTSFDDIVVEIPDYKNLKKPLMEVFTLDPIACAACTYMFAAASEVKEILGDKIDMVEHRYTKRESIVRVRKMGVTALPSIYINGELKYPSIIPSREELLSELEKYM